MKDVLQPGVTSDTRKVLVLGGMGGVGKTQLAIAYAIKHPQLYTSVIWLNATSEATLKASLRQVARRLLAPEMERQCDDDLVHAHVSRWLSDRDNDQWLLIFDNYDEPEEYDITQHYPYASHGSIVITTRSPDRVSGEEIRMLPMSDETEGLTILERRSGRQSLRSS
jgi:NB-ARC domain